jgi:hypothetical protein
MSTPARFLFLVFLVCAAALPAAAGVMEAPSFQG